MSQQPTFHITKEHFVGVINSLHAQFLKDKANSEALGQIFNTDAGYYDNSVLINAIFSFLHESFPKDEDGHCEIEHYAYVCNFGKVGDSYESPEELFDRLLSLQVPASAKKFTIVGPTFIGGPSNTSVAYLYAEDASTSVLNDWAQFETKRTASEMHHSAKMAMERISSKPSPDETA